jgi:uncharacterized protein
MIGGIGLLLDVSRAMRTPGEAFPFVHHEQIQPQDICGEEVSFDGPVVLEGHFSMSGENLTLEGVLYATAHSRCCNCLEPATVELKVPFHEVFTRLDRYNAELMEDDDPDRLVFSGSKVELSHLTLTIALLDLPIRFLCREDCDGYKYMAPQMNHASHRMDAPVKENPFSVLQQLMTKDHNDQEV